ncbi:hypothetical protein SAMN05421854_101431 [Amycolatopsis rubida]|uniref:Uncharacterized protein n=1 Tax=Amycolatopsis rubida TaxID=112413 RepID=A0A1I5E0F7_9PSEU|nr:hypothetical protein SAMN05421854_101431 [Amycolatopsis rubida]
MATRTDFYVGTGTAASWIGSLQFACHPDNLLRHPDGHAALTARRPSAYRAAVRVLLTMWPVEGLGAAFEPRNGWPWYWETSHCNDWIVSYHDNAVHLTGGGGDRWHRLDPEDPCPPLLCGPPDFARWLRDPGGEPAVRLPTYHAPGSRTEDWGSVLWRLP